jgi:hypothetical protein
MPTTLNTISRVKEFDNDLPRSTKAKPDATL